jgi:HSP20 family protein
MNSEDNRHDSLITSSVERLRHELDRWLDMAWAQGERAMDTLGRRGGERDWCPPVDVRETGDSVLVDVELPGVHPAAVDVTLAGHMLTIVAPIEPRPEEGEVRRSERPRGRFKRSIPLPVSVDADKVDAETKHGILHITIGKTETAREKRVPVRGTEADSFTGQA